MHMPCAMLSMAVRSCLFLWRRRRLDRPPVKLMARAARSMATTALRTVSDVAGMSRAVQPAAKKVSAPKIVANDANPMRATPHPPRLSTDEGKIPNMIPASVIGDMLYLAFLQLISGKQMVDKVLGRRLRAWQPELIECSGYARATALPSTALTSSRASPAHAT